MRVPRAVVATLVAVLLVGVIPSAAVARTTDATPGSEAAALCSELFGGVYETPSAEPLAECQWDMALINADDGTRALGLPARACASACSTAVWT